MSTAYWQEGLVNPMKQERGEHSRKKNIAQTSLPAEKHSDMPTSPVKTRIPITSFGHLITEVKKQLFGIEAPASGELTGWRKHFNSYTLQGRRNFVLVTYGVLAGSAAAYWFLQHSREETRVPSKTACLKL